MKRRAALGVSILLGVSLTGCGTFDLGKYTTSHNTQNGVNSTTTSVQPSQHKKGSSSSTKGEQSSDTAPVTVKTIDTPQYPSFGLGASGPAVLALNERLAELGYLPVQIQGGQQPQISLANIESPPQAAFSWRYTNVPSGLEQEWQPNTFTEMTRGAVISVEHDNGLPIDGIAGPAVWNAILGSSAAQNTQPYTYVLVTENPAPETLRVWKDGTWVYQALANTGIPQAQTTNGTFAVYLRYLSQTMTGKDPDGQPYSDPGVPYVNYFNGSEAIHGFERASYGSPQSLGCVELSASDAQTVWSLIDYGTLVTISGHYVAPSQTNQSSSSTDGTSKQTSSSGTSGSTQSGSSKTGATTTTSKGSGTSNATGSGHTTSGNGSTGNATGSGASNSTGTGNSTSGNNSTGNSTGTNSTSGNTTNTGTENDTTGDANNTNTTGATNVTNASGTGTTDTTVQGG
ncbi:L,D-transpeptidase family protein [Alicyclobacillus fodiniaquatilis]|uniref:L,D-transpeptidase family protein n=1 Tax=Alicyclobacillus fodiniaquatilis TaxID=1661150 RepID=A0ABW4JF64_9BACL